MRKRIRRDDTDKLRRMLEESAISIEAFIAKCLGLYDDEIMQARLSHKDLVKMFPKLERTNFDAIMDDPSCLYTGDVVIVSDANNKLVPYLNMRENSYKETDEFNYAMSSYYSRVKQDKTSEEQEEQNDSDVLCLDKTKNNAKQTITWGKKDTSKPHAIAHELNDMSVHTLEELMFVYSKLGQRRDYEIVRKELLRRPDCNRANKKCKRKALERSRKRIEKEDEY